MSDTPQKLRTFETDPTKTFLRDHEESCAADPTMTVMQLFEKTVAAFPSNPAMKVKRDGVLITRTYAEVKAEATRVSKSLLHLGHQAHEVTLIMGFNSPEWSLAALGTVFAGGLEAGVYASNGVEATEYQVAHSKASIVFCEDERQTAKFLDIRGRSVGNLKHIVQWGGTKPEGADNVHTWPEFLALGDGVADSELAQRQEAVAAGNACALIYTSGTTGSPKAVMLSHDNVVFTAKILARELGNEPGTDRVLSYLPMSHIAAQMVDLFCQIVLGGCCHFAPPTVMKEMIASLQQARPTIFFGVPRVWEKVEEALREAGSSVTGLKRTVADWAKGVGASATTALAEKKPMPWGYWLARKAVLEPIKVKLGLDACTRFYTGAAPTKRSTVEFFAALDIPVMEIYGMSECSGPESLNTADAFKIGTCGQIFADPSHEIKIFEEDEFGEGEVCWRGRHVMMGYMHNVEETAKAVDEDGFLHSGDLGNLDADKYVRITGRKKELIITAGGENIPPALIEGQIKKALDCVSNAMVIGDQRKYLTVVLTLKCKVGATGEPTPELAGAAFSVEGSTAKTLDEAKACPVYKAHIEAGLAQANSFSQSHVCRSTRVTTHPHAHTTRTQAQRVQYFRLVPEFSLEGGEFTPTLKLRRKQAVQKHAAAIQEMVCRTLPPTRPPIFVLLPASHTPTPPATQYPSEG